MNFIHTLAGVAILLWMLEVMIGIGRILAAIAILGLIWLAIMLYVTWEPPAPPRDSAPPPPEPQAPPPPPPAPDPLNVPPAWMFDERRNARRTSAATNKPKRRTSSC